jgi:tetratricopeptide (TPR) repeat protein
MKAFLFFILLYFFANTISFAQPSFSIKLLVEDSSAYSIYHNEPLIFSTSLANETLQQNLEWNQEAETWLIQVAADYKAGKLSKEEFEKETELVTNGKKEVNTATVGTKQSPWFQQLQFRAFLNNGKKQVSWPLSILGDPFTDSTATLDEDGYYQVRHHLSPMKVARQKAGTYTIQVLLAGVFSNEVTVKIRKEDIPAGVLNSVKMQLRLGNYYLDRKDGNKALDHANAVLKKNPRDLSGLMLCGEAYILKKKYKLSLECFEKALQQHRKKFSDIQEQPVYLIGTIAWLKEKL